MQIINTISFGKVGEILSSGTDVKAIIYGEIFDIEKPKRKVTIQEYLLRLNGIEVNFCVTLIDGDTGELVYTMQNTYCLPPCFAELKVRKATVNYDPDAPEIAIEI